MNPLVKNSIAVIVGLILGSIANMALITVSSSIIPPPDGADVTTVEGLKNAIQLFEPKHFIFPFLAHAIGTLVGAFVAAKLAANHPKSKALIVGGFFFLGGLANSFMVPAPIWFIALDLLVAYFPMAIVGNRLAQGSKK